MNQRKSTVHSLFLSFLITALVILVGACAGGPQLDTFNKKVLGAYATVQTVAESANAALVSGKLSKADAQNVVVTSRAALAAIDVAEHVHATDPAAGENKLLSALVILQALQAYLVAQGVK